MNLPLEELYISQAQCDQIKSFGSEREVQLFLNRGDIDHATRLGAAVLLTSPEHLLDALVASPSAILASAVTDTAIRWITALDPEELLRYLPQDFHPFALEFLSKLIVDRPLLDRALLECFQLEPVTFFRLAGRANERTAEDVVKAKQHLLICPEAYWALVDNESCTEVLRSQADSFLRMQNAFVERAAADELQRMMNDHVPAQESASSSLPLLRISQIEILDLDAEIVAALGGQRSPTLRGAVRGGLINIVEHSDAAQISTKLSLDTVRFELGASLGGTEEEESSSEERMSLEQRIAQMSVGHKIKLAYRGNKEARSILIRDTNKSVSVAVVKSGRLTDAEVSSYAGNRNLSDEVIREICRNKEFTRKYPVRVALINNPKTPVSVALSFLSVLNKRDLQNLGRNRGVSSVVSNAARKRFREKFRKS